MEHSNNKKTDELIEVTVLSSDKMKPNSVIYVRPDSIQKETNPYILSSSKYDAEATIYLKKDSMQIKSNPSILSSSKDNIEPIENQKIDSTPKKKKKIE